MSLVELVMAAEAAQAQKAVRRTAYRHQHLTDRPLVVVAYNLSGEAAAPLGIMWGQDPDPASASLAVSAEPRNRESRFAAINDFAAGFADYVRPHLELETQAKKGGGFKQVTASAPQIITPNRGTRAYLGSRLGRSLRYLDFNEDYDVPEDTLWAGSHLSWLAEYSNLPGQSCFLAMTESLAQHFVTGQSALEDENLASMLAWVEGVEGDMLPILESLESRAFGPVPNPEWEATLEPFVKAYSDGLRTDDDERTRAAFDRVEREVRLALSEAFEATHRAIGILRRIQPANGVAKRWQNDVMEWSEHARRCARVIPRFARRHDPLRAAKTLQKWSSAAEVLETTQAFDDPLIMARLDAEGRCITGTVASIDWDNREIKPGNTKPSKVPLVELSLTASTRLLEGEVIRCAEDPRVRGEVRALDPTSATIAVLAGVKALGEIGLSARDEWVFVGLDPWGGMDPWSPDEVPWTHRETTSELNAEGPVDPSTGAVDDSPDLSLEELEEIPVMGPVGPADEPGTTL